MSGTCSNARTSVDCRKDKLDMALDVVVSSLTDASVSVRGKPFKFGSLRKRLSYLGQSQLPVKLKNLSSGDFVK